MFATLRKAVLFGVGCLLITTVSVAQNNRSAVSLTGIDTATCTVPDPCRTFDVAMSKSNAGAEVIVLSSAGYGPFTVTKPVSIISPLAFHAAMAPTTGTAITVNASEATVILKGLYLNGSLGASIGINASFASTVYIENCTVDGFSGTGIFAAMPDQSSLIVRDSVVRNNGLDGIRFEAGFSGIATATIENVLIAENGDTGLVAFTNTATARVVARNVTSVGNANQFFASVSPGAGTVNLDLESCSAIGSGSTGFGVRSFGSPGTAVVRVSNSTITANGTGVFTSLSSVLSRGNNTLEGNQAGNDFSGSFTPK